MIKILVVDDEPIVRSTFANFIDWKNHGFLLNGFARNGAEALEIIKSAAIDIVITDLKMPVMTGLELIALALKEQPNLKFIVMSGFDDFHLVNEAYKLGVKEYFLKMELHPDSVLNTLLTLADELQLEKERGLKEEEQNQKLKKMEQTILHNQLVLQENLLKELFWGSNIANTILKMNEQGIEIDENQLFVMVIKLKKYYIIEKENWDGDRELFKFAILNVINEVLEGFGRAYAFCNLPHEYVVISALNNIKSESKKQGVILRLFEQMQESMINCFGIIIDCGLSNTLNGYQNCKLLYQQAQKACECCFLKGKGQMVPYSDVRESSDTNIIEYNQKVQKIKDVLKSMDAHQILSMLSELRVDVVKLSTQCIDEIKNLFYIYDYEILNFVKLHNIYEPTQGYLNRYDADLKEYGSLPELNKWIYDTLLAVANEIEHSSMIHKAKSYIQKNYPNSISLTEVANYLGIGEHHLSRLFQKEANISFMQYLLKVRIEAAIYLMENTNYKMYEISEKVGYANPEQFSRMFKKIVGKSPKEYSK